MEWTPEMGMTFKTSRRVLLEAPTLAFLDIHSQTLLPVCVSEKGISKAGTYLSFKSMEKTCDLFTKKLDPVAQEVAQVCLESYLSLLC